MTLISALILIAAALLIGVLSQRSGINIAPDEAHFIGYVYGLQQGRGLTMLSSNYDSPEILHTLSWWPPLYPLVVAAVSFGGNPLIGLWIMDMLGLIALGLLTAWFAYRVLGTHFHAVAAGLLIMTVPGTIYPFSRGAAETLFIPLMLGAWITTLNYQIGVPKTHYRSAIVLFILLALGTLSRNLMIAITLAICLYLLWWAWSVRGKGLGIKPYLHILIVGLSVVPFALFSLYNGVTNGNPLGMHRLSPQFKLTDFLVSLDMLAQQTGHGVRNTLNLFNLRPRVVNLIGFFLFVALMIGLVIRAWTIRKQRIQPYTSISALWFVIIVTVVYAGVYLGMN